MTRLSVIVLIYNMEKLLPRCLSSLENQTMNGIEFVLVDDGSTDGSAKICDEFKPKNHTVKVIHKKNENVVAGWMDGVSMANGEYVGFVDSDDYIEPNMYEELFKAIDRDNVDISMCSHCYEKNSMIKKNATMLENGIYKGEKLNEVRYKVLPKIKGNYLSPSLCNKVFRKELFKDNFRFCDKQVTIADDVSIVIPTLFEAKSFSYIDEPYYHYCVREGSTTYTYRENMYYQHEKLLENLKKAFDEYKPEIEKESFDYIVNFMGAQWLRMLYRSRIKGKKRRELLRRFYSDTRYIESAKNTKEKVSDKWERAYIKVILEHKYYLYTAMLTLLKIRNKLLRK